jgi:hypothetical protein
MAKQKTTPNPIKGRRPLRWDGADIRQHLKAGKSVGETSRLTKKAPRSIYEYAERHQLPTNPTILPNSKREAQVLRALVATNINLKVVASLFKTVPINIKAVVDRVQLEPRTRA